ncbi:DUF4386 family protein [Aduncisulcus paluster]|uniref:DUF4386 family protein n=1 Tax=Aduncisulcus paluster TaxID=2918883 RepID=A0ABQ5KFR3_9EUKA|nr:DUF4386 family protein [Aduncisulcus paluster]
MLETDPQAAAQFYRIISDIHVGLGGGNEIAGAMWTLIISLVCLKQGLFKKWINIVGVIVGVAGLLTISPALFDYTVMVFALGQMLWWFGIGLDMVRSSGVQGK